MIELILILKKGVFTMTNKETKAIPIGVSMRKIKRLSKEDVVNKLKELGSSISIYTLRNYEAGETDMPTSVLINLSKIYDCSVYDLLDYQYKKNNYLPMANYETYTLNHDHQLISNKKRDLPYNFMTNITNGAYDYAHAMLNYDDPNTNLPQGSRLIYKRRDYFDIKVQEDYDIFLVTKSFTENDMKGSKTFFTKAKLIANSRNPKLVQYFEDGKTEHMSSKYFNAMIDGVVVKVIIDYHTKNTKVI